MGMMKTTNENKLINEKSPYLLQHAHNPVNWYPWSPEAFEKAAAEDKPVFLSIGYSTCHWCHVMERESFEDSEVAQVLNEGFVCVKVDREERPDVDAVYMSVCQALTGQGGWPLTIIMSADKKPFYAATYLPKNNRYGMIGIIDLLQRVLDLWENSRKDLSDTGNKIIKYLQDKPETKTPQELSKLPIDKAFKMFEQSFDKKYAGFGNAPKFPSPHNLLFLMKYFLYENNSTAKDLAEQTLTSMYKGGIFDHIGGGFSRYSTDEKWLVPHFEKMLYDNALLIMAYLEAYNHTKNKLYAKIAKKTIAYVLRELSDGEGFYCGQDADSEGIEGKYYVFEKQEIKNILGEDDSEEFCEWFDITKQGNFEGKNIPNLLKNPDYEKDNPKIDTLSKKLFEYRLSRTKLHIDDKFLTSWNSLMITALSKAFIILKNDEYIKAAQNAENFISEKLAFNESLYVRYRDGESAIDGKLDDYAFYVWALLELYNATFSVCYLKKAFIYAKTMCEQFFDYENGGFYLYAKDSEQLIIKPKEVYDGAIPSGNAVAAYVLVKLSAISDKEEWLEISDKQLKYLAGSVAEYPSAHSFGLIALMNALNSPTELIAVSPSDDDLEKLSKLSQQKENITIIVKTKESETMLSEISPLLKEYPLNGSLTQFYLCKNRSCSAPVSKFEELNL